MLYHYSSHDQAFAERLHADLQAKGLRCWFAPEDLKIGDRFQERIEESIRLFDKVMIVLSNASIKSKWVEREVNAAREREDREKRTVLFPIRIDNAVMNAPAALGGRHPALAPHGGFLCVGDEFFLSEDVRAPAAGSQDELGQRPLMYVGPS